MKPHYFIDLDYFKSEDVSSHIKAFEKGMTATVSYENYDARVWTAELFCILSNLALPLSTPPFPIDTVQRTVNGQLFIPLYIDAYKKGVKYFQDEYLLTKETLYTNPKLYVDNLHMCYFHKEPINEKFGWVRWKESYPVVLTEKAIGEYGFFAGVLYEVNELMRKHPALFIDFKKCPETKNLEKKLLKEIFSKPEYFECCKHLMVEYEVLDEKGKTLLKKKGHGYLHAIIDALKSIRQPKLLDRDTYTDDELREYFSTFLGVKVAQIKRDKNAVMYNEKKEDAILKLRASIGKK